MEDSTKVVLSKEELCRSMRIVGINRIATLLRIIR